MSKERLEKAKYLVDFCEKEYEYDYIHLIEEDIISLKWLIEQAERVRELEEESERYQRHLFEARNDVASQSRKLRKAKEHKDDLADRIMYVTEENQMLFNGLKAQEKQNKRYRETIENVRDELLIHYRMGGSSDNDALMMLDEALEGELDERN